MELLNVKNNAQTTLSSAITASSTSFTVVNASLFPPAPFRITIDSEIMQVGAINVATNTFSSVTRGVEGTTAASHASGATVENRWTAGTYDDLVAGITAATDKANAALPKTGGIISGLLTVLGLAGVLKLKRESGTAGRNYIRFSHADDSDMGYIGFGGSSNNHMQIYNESANGDVDIRNGAGGAVRINGENTAFFVRGDREYGTYISAADINAIVNSGFYWMDLDSSPNLPVASKGYLIHAEASNYCYQQFIPYAGNNGVYWRVKTGGVWSSWKGMGGVKNVQRGKVAVTASGTVNVTVSAVNMSKSFLNVINPAVSLGSSSVWVHGSLTSSTNIAITNEQSGGGSFNISWELIEYY